MNESKSRNRTRAVSTGITGFDGILDGGYRYRSHHVEQATRALLRATRNVSRAVARGTQRQTQLKDSAVLRSQDAPNSTGI
jgi:hypothetical protein